MVAPILRRFLVIGAAKVYVAIRAVANVVLKKPPGRTPAPDEL
jgi:hypothetical protein